MDKKYLDINVYEAARERLRIAFADFEKIYVSFSAGKDSGVLLNLAIEVAREMGKLPVHALFIDLEAQYRETIAFATRQLLRPEVKPYWICLPLNLRNSVSQLQTNWRCWDPDAKKIWVRDMPKNVINLKRAEELGWDWFQPGMEFERFIVDFPYWFGDGKDVCTLVGIRAQESLHRYTAVAGRTIETKPKWKDYNWTSQIRSHLYNGYPIYDWKSEDIWIANARESYDYNHIYDLFYLAGLTMKDMRICQPYGDDQRKGLHLFRILEHDTWEKVVNRVAGANYGQRYVHDKALAEHGVVALPEGYTYESYAKFLLDTLPTALADNYREKIDKFLVWWKEEGYASIPDHGDVRLESKKMQPSWRRICKMILKNDYVGKSLSFGLTKADKQRQYEIMTYYMEHL